MTPLPSGLPEHVADDEVLARHVFTSNKSDLRDDRKGNLSAKYNAFMPQPSDDGWVRSVTRTRALGGQAGIERNGQEVGHQGSPQRVLHATILFTAAAVRSVEVRDKDGNPVGSMDVLAAEPPDHHAHLVNYPDRIDGENPKELQKEVAQDLADTVNEVLARQLPLEVWEQKAEELRHGL
jgi:hypothetical protein